MQIKIMRHHGRSQNADRDIEHLSVLDNFESGNKPAQHRGDAGLRENNFHQETAADHDDQSDDQRFNVAEALVLKIENHQNVERGNAYTPHQRDFEQQVQ